MNLHKILNDGLHSRFNLIQFNKHMIDKNTILSFLEYYELTNATAKPISGGLSGCALMIDRKDKKYVLKIYNKDSNIETEAQFGHSLYRKKIPTAKIIKNSKDQIVTAIDNLRGVLFEFCTGEPIEWNDISVAFSEHLAEIVAKMHLLILNDTEIPAKNYHKCEIEPVADLSNLKIIQKSKEIENSIKEVDYSGLRQALIHSDLTRQNVLATKDRNDVDAIIDFGDAHRDYIAWDLAVLITHIFITKTYGIDWGGLSVFIKKYYSMFPLTEQEINALIPFIKIRNLNLAIEVNRLALNKNENIEELMSIENSVMTKLDTIDKNQNRLSEVLKG